MEDFYEVRYPIWPGRIYYYPEIGSTNTYVMENLDNYKHLDVVVAERQVAGKGRHDRVWLAGPESLTFSQVFTLYPAEDFVVDEHTLPQIIALSLVEFLDMLDIKASLKWPNDVIVGKQKIAGILGEGKLINQPVRNPDLSSSTKKMVVGIGININQTREMLLDYGVNGTSVLVESGERHNLKILLERYLNFILPFINLWMNEGFVFFLDKYKQRCDILGKKVEVDRGGNIYKVKILDITKDGYLEVKGHQGKELLTFGEILI